MGHRLMFLLLALLLFFLEVRNGGWSFITLVTRLQFQMKDQKQLLIFIQFFSSYPESSSFHHILNSLLVHKPTWCFDSQTPKVLFLSHIWMALKKQSGTRYVICIGWFYNRANICLIEASFLERYGLALQQRFNSHKPCYLFCYFPATLKGSSVLVPSAEEGAEIVKEIHIWWWGLEQVRQE